MPQHAPLRQQIITALAAFNQQRNTLSHKQAASVRRFDVILARIKQPPILCSHRSLTGEFLDLLVTYREYFTTLSQNALLSLKRYSPAVWGIHESQWQKISGQLYPFDTKLVSIMAVGIFFGTFCQLPPALTELLNMPLFCIAQRPP